MTRLVILDCETTSLDDERGEVWEVGLIVRDPDQADAEYLWEIRPDLTTADPMSLAVGRYYERRVLSIHAPGEAVELVSPRLKKSDSHQTFTGAAAVARKLAELLVGATVVGGNPGFDYRFLRRFLTRHNECWTADYHLVDVQALAVGYIFGHGGDAQGLTPHIPWKSRHLYEAVGVNPGDFDTHTALGDARLACAVFDAITGGAGA